MIMKISFRCHLASAATIAFLCIFAQASYAQEQTGHLAVAGMVKLNGRPAATGDIVSSGSTVETAKGSSSVVSLGKLGRVEALPETQMKLDYDHDRASIAIVLDKGSVRVSTGPGVSATVTKKKE